MLISIKVFKLIKFFMSCFSYFYNIVFIFNNLFKLLLSFYLYFVIYVDFKHSVYVSYNIVIVFSLQATSQAALQCLESALAVLQELQEVGRPQLAVEKPKPKFPLTAPLSPRRSITTGLANRLITFTFVV